MPFFPRPSAKKYALNLPSEHCRDSPASPGRQRGWYGAEELNGTGRGTRSYRKQEQPKHGEGVAKTELKKQGQTNENIYIRIYIVWAPKILCNKNANDARTSADSFRLSLDSRHNLCSYAYLLFALDAEWWIEVDGGWKVLRSRAPAAGDSRCWFC